MVIATVRGWALFVMLAFLCGCGSPASSSVASSQSNTARFDPSQVPPPKEIEGAVYADAIAFLRDRPLADKLAYYQPLFARLDRAIKWRGSSTHCLGPLVEELVAAGEYEVLEVLAQAPDYGASFVFDALALDDDPAARDLLTKAYARWQREANVTLIAAGAIPASWPGLVALALNTQQPISHRYEAVWALKTYADDATLVQLKPLVAERTSFYPMCSDGALILGDEVKRFLDERKIP